MSVLGVHLFKESLWGYIDGKVRLSLYSVLKQYSSLQLPVISFTPSDWTSQLQSQHHFRHWAVQVVSGMA